MRARRIDEERVGRKERGDRETLAGRRVFADLTVHREDDGAIDRSRGALRRELEVAQIDHLVAPELHAHGIGHAEGVHVEDATAETELRNVLHHGHALETDALEMRGELARPAHIAFPELDAQILERAGEPRALEERARRREQNADLAAAQALQRLHALSRHLDVRLDLTESLTRGIQRDRRLV